MHCKQLPATRGTCPRLEKILGILNSSPGYFDKTKKGKINIAIFHETSMQPQIDEV